MKEMQKKFYELWDEFLDEWPLSRVQNMNLSEYTDAGSHETFTYWIENRLDQVGSIWGGSAFKFGIYSRADSEHKEGSKGRIYSEKYGWYAKYGDTVEEAFLNVRNIIIAIISASQEGNVGKLDGIDLGNAFKWKIAFHYQDRKKPCVLAIFAQRALQALAACPKGTPISKMHTELLKTKQPEVDLVEFGQQLWRKYEALIAVSDDDVENLYEANTQNQLPFYSGLILGSGANAYKVIRSTEENIEMRRLSDAVDRYIPTVVIKALCDALDRKQISLNDLQRRQNTGEEHIFDRIGLNHDKFIMGYDASIIKLCKYYIEQKTNPESPRISNLIDAVSLTSAFSKQLTESLCSALLAKRFTIFTGLSGSGKTLQAISFVQWICRKKAASFIDKLRKALDSEKITENYDIHNCSACMLELVNKKGGSGKIIPLPVGALEEWYVALKNGVIDAEEDPKETRHMVGEQSNYQKYIHGFYNDMKKVAVAIQEVTDASTIVNGAPQYEVVAVGADWTSNENLLGYPDALNPGHYRKPDNGALDLILRAKTDLQNPYFLILDEMNLSHVERYFADFLSAMESGEAISLHDGGEDDLWPTEAGEEATVPGKLKIPENLFVIGTVNVDETTYMFSPKVLDRANVIEFRVSEKEMSAFLDNPVKPKLHAIAGQGVKYAKAFVDAATHEELTLKEDLRKQVSEVLMQFFPELKRAGAEFGYRTAHEICRFIHFHKELSGASWRFDLAMDAAIMQKLLPKLHGSKKKLSPVLDTLIPLCLKDGVLKTEGTEHRNDPIKDEILDEDENVRYPVSLEKLRRMRMRLQEHGFASFAEA